MLADLGSTVSVICKLAGRGSFGRVRFFALRDLDVRGFHFRDGIQSSAKLTGSSAQIPPFWMRRSTIGRDALLIEFFLKGRQLRVGSFELPFQVIAFQSHVGFDCLKQNQSSRFGPKTSGDCGKNVGRVQRRKCSMDLKNRLNFHGDVAGK